MKATSKVVIENGVNVNVRVIRFSKSIGPVGGKKVLVEHRNGMDAPKQTWLSVNDSLSFTTTVNFYTGGALCGPFNLSLSRLGTRSD